MMNLRQFLKTSAARSIIEQTFIKIIEQKTKEGYSFNLCQKICNTEL